jgi:hypothetical protein
MLEPPLITILVVLDVIAAIMKASVLCQDLRLTVSVATERAQHPFGGAAPDRGQAAALSAESLHELLEMIQQRLSAGASNGSQSRPPEAPLPQQVSTEGFCRGREEDRAGKGSGAN